MTYMYLPAENWSGSTDGWSQIPAETEGAISLGYTLPADGAIWFKYVDDGLGRTPDVMLFSTPTLEGGTDVVDIWVTGGNINWESSQIAPTSEPVVNGTFYGLVRTGGYLYLLKTTDGVTFTTIEEFGTKTNVIYVFSWNFEYETNKLYYLQGSGVSLISEWNLSNLEISNGNDFTPTGSDARGWTKTFIPAGGVGEIWGRSYISIFGLDAGEWSEPYHSISFGVWRNWSGNAAEFNDNTSGAGIEVPEGTYLRVRTDGTLIHQEYSLDNGATWLPLREPLEQPNIDLYGKISTDPGEHLDDVILIGFIE